MVTNRQAVTGPERPAGAATVEAAGDAPSRRRNGRRWAAFFIPLLALALLLYQALATLGIAVLQRPALNAIGVALALGVVLGVVAALGEGWLRLLVLAATVLLLTDVVLHLPQHLESLRPEVRARRSRDRQLISAVRDIETALEEYIQRSGRLPAPSEYGEGMGPPNFWGGWWDASGHDGDGDGRPFLDFLVEGGTLPEVPLATAAAGGGATDPRAGRQLVYFLVPPGYLYEGGTCGSDEGKWVYLLAVSSMENASERAGESIAVSGCRCLWRDQPAFFAQHFAYTTCGTFIPRAHPQRAR